MMTYLLLDIVFVVIIGIVFRIKLERPSKKSMIAAFILLFLTFVFDSLLVYFHLIDYAQDKISGLRIGLAPIEDYFYPIVAVVLIPLLWKKFGKKHD
jgi:lycopene cyclase domain-containing protein